MTYVPMNQLLDIESKARYAASDPHLLTGSAFGGGAAFGKGDPSSTQNLPSHPNLDMTVDFTTEENGHIKVGINRLDGIWGSGETLDIALNEIMILIKSKIENLHKSYLRLQLPPKVTVTIENNLVCVPVTQSPPQVLSYWVEGEHPEIVYKEKRYISFIKDLDGNSHEKHELSE